MRRAALAEVLATLTGKPPLLVVLGRACGVAIEASRVGYRPQSDRAATHGSAPTLWHRWTHDSPAEAVEALATARLWPWEPGDDPTLWWCEFLNDAIIADPPTFAALVAVASLGAPSLVTAVELAGVLAPGAVVVWRAMTREALRAWTEERVYRDGDASLAYVVAHEHLGAPNASPLRYGNPAAWPESFPWLGLHGMHVARQSWSEVRALGMLGAPPLSIDSSRIVLAVEAL